MIDIKIVFRLNDFAKCKQILETVFADLNWDYRTILNQSSSYGGFCTVGKLSDDSVRVLINENSEQNTKAFLKVLYNYHQNVRFVEILYNNESANIVYQANYSISPVNTGEDITGQYVNIDYSIF